MDTDGYGAGHSNTTGSFNTAIGSGALSRNTTASNNTAVGYQALYTGTTGERNTAVGNNSGYLLTSGSDNACFGRYAGFNITTGTQNTCIGTQAGYLSLTTGINNILIGYYCATNAASDNNSIVIGAGLTGKGGNTGFINPGGGGVFQGNNSSSWSTTSDRRLKKNIVDNNEGLEKIAAIRVRNFEYRLPEEVDAELKPTDAIDKAGVQLGVIAQELQEVCPDCVTEQSTGVLSVDTDNLTWHMINAIKQLKSELDSVKAELATLKGN
jgi:hypothetical protein